MSLVQPSAEQGQLWGLSNCPTHSWKPLRMETTQPLLATVLAVRVFSCTFRRNLSCSNLHLLSLALLPCAAVNPWSSRSAPAIAAQEAGGPLHCLGAAGSCSSRCPPGPPGLFSRSCSPAVSPQPVSLQGALPSRVQEFRFVLVDFHKAPVSHSSSLDRSKFSVNSCIYT